MKNEMLLGVFVMLFFVDMVLYQVIGFSYNHSLRGSLLDIVILMSFVSIYKQVRFDTNS